MDRRNLQSFLCQLVTLLPHFTTERDSDVIANAISPKPRQCAKNREHCPCLGEIGDCQRAILAFLTQHLDLGEMRWHNVPAWEEAHEKPTRLPGVLLTST